MASDYGEMPPGVRPAELGDAPRLGEIHVRAWQAAYAGVMPADYLDGLKAEVRAAMWTESLSAPPPGWEALVVEDASGVQGFAVFGPEEHGAGRSDVGELYGINLDPDSWGLGMGRSLLRAAVEKMRSDGYAELVLWVVPSNDRARRLYDSEGWGPDGAEREEELLGVRIFDIRYRIGLGGP